MLSDPSYDFSSLELSVGEKQFLGSVRGLMDTMAGAAIIARARIEEHHLFVKEMNKNPILKELGINLESQGNKILALQNGFTAGHREYNDNVKDRVETVLNAYSSGAISKSQALERLAIIRRDLRQSLSDNPLQLARKKSDPPLEKPVPKQENTSNSSSSGGNTSSTSTNSSSGRFFSWLFGT